MPDSMLLFPNRPLMPQTNATFDDADLDVGYLIGDSDMPQHASDMFNTLPADDDWGLVRWLVITIITVLAIAAVTCG